MRKVFVYSFFIIIIITFMLFLLDLVLRSLFLPPSITLTLLFFDIFLGIITILSNINGLIDLINKIYTWLYSPIKPSLSEMRRNRERLIKKVRFYWIHGVLENSLHRALLIELGMREHSEMVSHPWDTIIQRHDDINEKGKLIPNIFSGNNLFKGGFLILGDPGSGKTTTLLELTKKLLDDAESDNHKAIPVVFNLSTWGIKRGYIKEWLLNELYLRYKIHFLVGTEFIENEELILMLDGLDEVNKNLQEECVIELNNFIQDHPVKIVITSRLFDYKHLSKSLDLEGAGILQPLSRKQIDLYLKNLGNKLDNVRKAINSEQALFELAQTPLVLSVIAMTYQSASLDELKTGTKKQKMDRLWEAYTNRMFEQRKIRGKYTSMQMINQLIWLAKYMKITAQTVFRIEQLQPDALSKDIYRKFYLAIITIILWLTVSGSFGFATGITLFYLSGSMISGIINGILYGITGAFAVWVVEKGKFKTIYRPIIGILTGLSFSITVWIFNHNLLIASLIFLILSAIVALMFNRIYIPKSEKEYDLLSNINIRRLNWSWGQGIKGFIRRMPVGIVFGIAGGLAVAGLFGWIKGTIVGVGFALLTSLIGGSALGIVTVEIEDVYKPNEDTWNMLSNSLRFGVFVGLLVGIIVGLLMGDIKSMSVGIISGFAFLITTFIISGLVFGGLQVIEHIILRILLQVWEDVPLNYPLFLNNSVYHIFLRNVGNGFIFIHRLLLEYFASINNKWVSQK